MIIMCDILGQINSIAFASGNSIKDALLAWKRSYVLFIHYQIEKFKIIITVEHLLSKIRIVPNESQIH